jgi:hypothetical protein
MAGGLRGYSFADKKKVGITHAIKSRKYQLPNGQTVTIICGKSKKESVVCTIVSNEKLKPCKSGKPRTKRGARCAK